GTTPQHQHSTAAQQYSSTAVHPRRVQHTRYTRSMARLARGKVRHERYEECLMAVSTAVICALAGHDDLFLVMGVLALVRLEAYEE
ncbi:unnamed protein product, partial [Pylaiella littoralis]